MNMRLQQLLMRHRLFNAAGADGADGGGGGAGSGGSEGTNKDDGQGKTGTEPKAGEQGSDDSKGKPSDAEAKLLKEVMDKKQKLKDAEAALAQVNAKLKEFEGIDPAAVRALLKEKEVAEQKKLEEQGEWEKLKTQMAEAHQRELQAREQEVSNTKAQNQTLAQQIADLTVGNAFGNCKFISEELVLTPAKARTVYGSHFEFKDGQIVGYDRPVNDPKRAPLVDGKGDPLPFSDSLKKIIDADPDRDQILKSKAKPGAGSRTDATKGSNTPAGTKDLSSRDRIKAGLLGLKKSS